MIRITSKKDGFRRCGIVHSKTPVDYPADRFSEKEIAAVKADPMLIVMDVPDKKESSGADIGGDLNAMTMAQLTKEILRLQPDASVKDVKKADLIKMLQSIRDAGKE